jgi:hypothetical protein
LLSRLQIDCADEEFRDLVSDEGFRDLISDEGFRDLVRNAL